MPKQATTTLQQAAELERKLMKLRNRQQERMNALSLKFKEEERAICGEYDADVREKVSRGDFKKDSDKPHRSSGGIGNLRYYLTPKGLLSPDEVPPPWGLLELVGERIFVRKQARAVTSDRSLDVAILVAELRRATEGWRQESERIGVAEDARAEREAAQLARSA